MSRRGTTPPGSSKNRLTAYRYSNGLTTRTQRFTYRADGMVEVCTAANGDRITNQYDSLKRLQKKTVEHDNSSAYTYEIQTTYQAGNETNRTTSLVQMYKYQYAGTNNFYATRYVYDNLGNIREVWRKYPNSATGGYYDEQISLYRYDDQNRLIYEENRLDGYTML